ncbi:MAG: phage major capsid protein, partial [Clostridia bacterium]|nr:phage major capsid protein [Clostridia bacterium]
YGDGSGVLCTTTSQSGNSIVVNNVKNITEGMIVDVIDPSTGDILFAGRKLLEVGRDNKIVYLGGDTISTGSIPTGSILTVQNSYNMEITGIGAIFGDSRTLYGLQRSDNPWLKPYTKTATTVNDIALQNCVDHLEDTVGSTANFIVCSSGVKRNYQDYMSTNRSNIDIMNLTGGCKALSFGGIPLISDRFVPQGTLYVLNTDDFHIHQLCDWRWLEDDNGRVLKQVAGKPVYTATLVKYADLICDRPIGQARITGVNEK